MAYTDQKKGKRCSRFFQVTTYTKICELHFKAEDIKVHSNSGKKEVKKGAEPCKLECWPKSTVHQREEKEPRKPPLCRSRPEARELDFSNCGEILENHLTGDSNESFQPVNTTVLGLALNEEVFVKTCSDCSKLKAEIEELKNENQILKTNNSELKSIINKLKEEEFSFINVQSDPERFLKRVRVHWFCLWIDLIYYLSMSILAKRETT